MHGKISDLNTEDAQKFSSNPLNEIGKLTLSIIFSNSTVFCQV